MDNPASMCEIGCHNHQGDCKALAFLHGDLEDQNSIDASKCYIMKLPSRLHAKIISFLDPVRSTSFGLTCKHLYEIHKTLHPERIKLSRLENVGIWSKPLHLLLRSWIGPSYIYSHWFGNKFYTIARIAEIREEARQYAAALAAAENSVRSLEL